VKISGSGLTIPDRETREQVVGEAGVDTAAGMGVGITISSATMMPPVTGSNHLTHMLQLRVDRLEPNLPPAAPLIHMQLVSTPFPQSLLPFEVC
jgi:hypothetical protein